ncbi:MAG: BrnT family toxin [Phenylobacterium sp.]|uniref:BrnT family toxin n=1 Tax=Phenylobacterium sp. TaxID=1871053 RepID=UPI002733A007|nr:BrnT family toxin [Phenylobacterium sp.]MDP1641652.1 BrnT family toxin [Phenylobacterium sp.]MDP3116767.1 BrnT family toxin [Phenylobacterium sp.]
MDISFDPEKSARNEAERGLPFSMAEEFIWDTALVATDERFDYGEDRWIALGFIGARLFVLVFTETKDGIRVISFRKANAREAKRYAQATQS